MKEDVKKAKLGLGLEEYSKSETFPEDKDPRQKIAELAKLIFDRNLSDFRRWKFKLQGG